LVWFGRVAVVNQLARQLLHVEHPNSEEIVSRQNQLNSKWSLLREKSELKREELISAHGVQVLLPQEPAQQQVVPPQGEV
jgi:hypothetical protein